MNCATHSDIAAVAFCRTCGKPLCNQCTRDVRGVIYCESCLAARMDATTPPQPGYVPPSGYVPPQSGYQYVDQGMGARPTPGTAPGPNPTVAGILGAVPIGLGAVYCGQYAKGLIHLGIVVLAIIGLSSGFPWFADMMLGMFLGFFWVYQIIDSVRTARAIQMGEPVPDPFGLVQMFGGGSSTNASAGGVTGLGTVPGLPGPVERHDPAKIPVAAAVLIGLGVLFLVNTVFDFSLHRYWPLILIVLGVWLFAKHWGLLATYRPYCVCERCRTRKLMGPAILVTLGVLFLLDNTSNIDFGKTWPAVVLVVGLVKLFQSNASNSGHIGTYFPPGGGYPPGPPMPPPGPPGAFSGTVQTPGQSTAQNPDPSSSGEVKNV